MFKLLILIAITSFAVADYNLKFLGESKLELKTSSSGIFAMPDWNKTIECLKLVALKLPGEGLIQKFIEDIQAAAKCTNLTCVMKTRVLQNSTGWKIHEASQNIK